MLPGHLSSSDDEQGSSLYQILAENKIEHF